MNTNSWRLWKQGQMRPTKYKNALMCNTCTLTGLVLHRIIAETK